MYQTDRSTVDGAAGRNVGTDTPNNRKRWESYIHKMTGGDGMGIDGVHCIVIERETRELHPHDDRNGWDILLSGTLVH